MTRSARIVLPHRPRHVVQRGNRRQKVFLAEADHALNKRLRAERCAIARVTIWAWCLMPNHVHLMAVPSDTTGLALAIGETHKRCTTTINRREGWIGHLWQGRFSSCPMDEPHAVMAARYIERNPVRAGLVLRPEDWRWSNARAHLEDIDDGLTRRGALDELVAGWRAHLDEAPPAWQTDHIRRHVATGRPLGDEKLLAAAGKAGTRQPRRPRPACRTAAGKKKM